MMHDVSQKELGTILGLTTRQIRRLEEQGLPVVSDGKRKTYPLRECVAWVRSRDVQAAVDKAKPTSFDELRIREMSAQAEKAEFEVAQLRRQVLTVDEWERRYSAALAQLRASLLAFPGRVAAVLPLPPVETLELIEPIVHEFMAELSEEPEDEAVDDAA